MDDLRVYSEAIPAGIDLVAEARASIIIYANVQARARLAGTAGDGLAVQVEIPEDAESRLVKAEQIFRELGASCRRSLRPIGLPLAFFAGWGLTLDRPVWHS